MRFSNLILLSILAMSLSVATASAKKPAPASPGQAALDREELMVLNLNRGPKSARFYMSESLKAAKIAEHNLSLAQHQVEQADAAFAKARNRPDDRAMQATVERLKSAMSSAQQLQMLLEEAEAELKGDIQNTLVR